MTRCSSEILACLSGTKWQWRGHVFDDADEKVLCLLANVPEIKGKQKKCSNVLLTALFTNTRILKFKSQLMFVFFAAVNHFRHFSGAHRKHKFTSTCSKGHGLWFVIGVFRSVLCVSVFQGLLLVIVIMIEFARVFEKRSKRTDVLELLPTGFGKSLIY